MRCFVETTDTETLGYRLGGLLYMPAFQKHIADKLEQNSIPGLSSIAFCLEDSIRDHAVTQAETALRRTLLELGERFRPADRLPLIFIRIRTPEHWEHLHNAYGDVNELITGYILPKFDLSNAAAYLKTFSGLRRNSGRPLYIMPILESVQIADASTRISALTELRSMLDEIRPHVLNIRVGCNDFSQIYGLRCPIHSTVYDIGILRDILTDILSIFAKDYIVAGPVWNYFGQDPDGAWAKGLRRELELDRLSGFIGKSAIHPSQIPLIAQSLSVTREDYDDACALLDWKEELRGVSKSARGTRMNEVKCHAKWALRTKLLGDIYGIREELG